MGKKVSSCRECPECLECKAMAATWYMCVKIGHGYNGIIEDTDKLKEDCPNQQEE